MQSQLKQVKIIILLEHISKVMGSAANIVKLYSYWLTLEY